jgi:hypothetical protein
MNDGMLLLVLVLVTYVVPAVTCWSLWYYDNPDVYEEGRGFCFAPLINWVGAVILVYERIERGSEYGRLKQELRREKTRSDLAALRAQVDKARTARIRELEKALDRS